jgi:hypothetical protein
MLNKQILVPPAQCLLLTDISDAEPTCPSPAAGAINLHTVCMYVHVHPSSHGIAWRTVDSWVLRCVACCHERVVIFTVAAVGGRGTV